MRIHPVLLVLGACGGGGDGGGGDDIPGGADAPKPAYGGYLSIQSYDAMNVPGIPTRGGTASASFYTGAGICSVRETVGPCDVSHCMPGPPAGQTSAGAITITGAQQPITLTPMSDKSYAQFTTAASLFAGGESITFSAAGADVPAFSHTLTTPSKTTVTSPVEPATQLMVPRGAEYSVRWSGGRAGVVQVLLFASNPDIRLLCRFSASGGTGNVPVAALMKLPVGDGGFAISAVNREAKVAGEYQVEVEAYYNAVWPDNSTVSGPALFQ